jgi:hypothetical protein
MTDYRVPGFLELQQPYASLSPGGPTNSAAASQTKSVKPWPLKRQPLSTINIRVVRTGWTNGDQ